MIMFSGCNELEIEMKPKKPRGRPKGSGIPTDPATLAAVADLMILEPDLKPTTAIKRVVCEWTDSIVHRLLGKWRKEKERYLAEAQKRKAVSASAACARAASHPGARLEEFGRTLDSPALRVAREIANSPSVRMAREIANSPAARMAREIADSPAMRMMCEIRNSPAMRMMREFENSPTMRAMRAMQNNPIVQMSRAQRDLWGRA